MWCVATATTPIVVAADKHRHLLRHRQRRREVLRLLAGDAFASGGSVGYDHKEMGITAKGAWESVKRHFREMGVDTQSEDFTVVGIGDMSGDVFGNGMLLSQAHPVARRLRSPARLPRSESRRRHVVGGTRLFELIQLGGLRPIADQRGRRRLQPPAEAIPITRRFAPRSASTRHEEMTPPDLIRLS